jgi:CrcB protein
MMLSTLWTALAIAALAAIGALLRYGLAVAFNDEFPTGTLAANVVASFALGLLALVDTRLHMVVGLGTLGALSTWSTVAHEAAAMAREDRGRLAGAYLALTVSSGVVAAWTGIQVARVL